MYILYIHCQQVFPSYILIKLIRSINLYDMNAIAYKLITRYILNIKGTLIHEVISVLSVGV